MAKIVLLLAIIASLVLSISGSRILYTRTEAPKGWTITGPTHGHESINFMVALKQRNMEAAEELFWQVSDPQHKNYQNFLTRDEILDMIAPNADAVAAVKNWLKAHGITKMKDFGDAIEVFTTVSVASKMFNTAFHHFTSQEGQSVIRQYGSYSIPIGITKYVEMITGISTFPVPHYNQQKARSPLDNVGVVAQTLSSIYQVKAQVPGSSNQTSQGVIEFQGQCFAPSDLSTYASQVGVTLNPVSSAHTVGPNDPTQAQTEAELDIQLIATVNTESQNWFWLEPGNNWLYDFSVHFFGTADIPQVISISYGWWEGGQCDIAPDECSQLGVNSVTYVARVNAEFLKIGLRGVSILSATGDSGANGRTNEDCSAPQLRAAFPGSSPYLTAVGATQLNNPVYNLPTQPSICTANGFQCPSGGLEVAVSYDVAGFASGGGFSAYTAQPSYQTAAVNAYLKSGVALPPASAYNATGRGFPDVAAIGHNTLIYQGGVQAVGGTSASTPIVSALIALLNEVAVKKSGKPLGFLNPLLYQAWGADKTIYHDITIGDNKCTEQGCASNCYGYMAYAGWDPVTGLGSLNFNKLSNYISTHFDAKLGGKQHHHHHQNKKH